MLNAEEIPAEFKDESLTKEESAEKPGVLSFTILTFFGAFKPTASGEEEPPPEHDEMKTESSKVEIILVVFKFSLFILIIDKTVIQIEHIITLSISMYIFQIGLYIINLNLTEDY